LKKQIIILSILLFPFTVTADLCGNNNGANVALYTNDWGTHALGSGLGASGFSSFDTDNDSYPEVLFGSGSGFGGNTSFAILEYDALKANYVIRCQSKTYTSGISKVASFSNTTIANGTIIAQGNGDVEIIDHSLGLGVQLIKTGITGINDIAVGDIDNDGAVEISFLSSVGITIYDANTYSYEQTLPQGGNSFVLGQFTDLINIEIAINTGLVIELVDTTATTLWNYQVLGFSNFYLAAADIDNDGLDEIAAADRWNGIRTFNADVKGILWEHTASHDINALQLYDTDGDSIPELVYGDGQWGSVHGLDGLTGILKWTAANPEHGVTDVLVADFDNDASLDLLWGSGFSSTGPDFLFINDIAQNLREWSSGDSDGPYYAVSYGDVDNDGVDEIVYASFRGGTGDGIVTAMEVDTREIIWQTSSNTFGGTWTGIHDIAVADLDGNGTHEVIVATDRLYDGRVHILDGLNGTITKSVVLESGSPIYSLKILDIDGDSTLEIIAGGGVEHTGSKGTFVYVIDGPTAVWESTFPSLGNQWANVWGLEAVDIDNDSTIEFIAISDTTFIIDPDNNGILSTTVKYHSVTSSLDVFSGNTVVYLGGADGSLYTLAADASTTLVSSLCSGVVESLETISAVRLAFTCNGRLAIYDVVAKTVSWQNDSLLDNNLGRYDRLTFANLAGKNTLLVGGNRVYSFVETNNTSGGVPVANDATFSSHFSDVITATLTASDPGGTPLSYGVYQQPQNGFVKINDPATGEFIYTPNRSYVGDVIFKYFVSNGVNASSLATVTLSLTNTKPVGATENVNLHWNTLYFGQLTGSDNDADNIRFELVSQPSQGVLVLLDQTTGEYTYYNTSPLVSSVQFEYRLSDGAEFSPVYQINLNLTNTLPIASNFLLETYYSVSLSTLITGQDSDGEELSYEIVTAPAQGTASLTSNGLLTYVPNSDQNYQVVIAYRVSDGRDWSQPGEIAVNVIGRVIPGVSPVYIQGFNASKYLGIGPLLVDFTLTAGGGSGNYSYEWDFGQGASSTESSPSHLFEAAGVYPVSVKITDVNNSNNFAVGYIEIRVISAISELNVNLVASVNSETQDVVFSLTITGGEAPYTITFDYGDGETKTITESDANVSILHNYSSLGLYNVSVVVTGKNSVGRQVLSVGNIQVDFSSPAVNASNDSGGGAFGFLMLPLLISVVIRKIIK